MNDSNRSTPTKVSPDLSAFMPRARSDWDGVQAVAYEGGGADGATRFELSMEWASREDAVRCATWAFGFDRAAIGQIHPESREFVVTDVIEKARRRGRLVVRHFDLVEGTDTVRPMDVDVSAAALSTAFATWQINARDFLALDSAYRTLAGDEVSEQQRSSATAVLTAARVKLGLSTSSVSGSGTRSRTASRGVA